MKSFIQYFAEQAEVPRHVAVKGAEHAENLIKASNAFSGTNHHKVELEFMKMRGKKFVSKGGPRVVDALKKAHEAHEKSSAEYTKAQDAASAHHKEHGHTVIQAWEAVHNKSWPHYKVNSGGEGPAKLKIAEEKVPFTSQRSLKSLHTRIKKANDGTASPRGTNNANAKVPLKSS